MTVTKRKEVKKMNNKIKMVLILCVLMQCTSDATQKVSCKTNPYQKKVTVKTVKKNIYQKKQVVSEAFTKKSWETDMKNIDDSIDKIEKDLENIDKRIQNELKKELAEQKKMIAMLDEDNADFSVSDLYPIFAEEKTEKKQNWLNSLFKKEVK